MVARFIMGFGLFVNRLPPNHFDGRRPPPPYVHCVDQHHVQASLTEVDNRFFILSAVAGDVLHDVHTKGCSLFTPRVNVTYVLPIEDIGVVVIKTVDH